MWHYEPYTDTLQCKNCNTYYIESDFRSETKAEKHCTSQEHKRNLELSKQRQSIISSGQVVPKNNFLAELTTMLERSNFPLYSVEGEDLKNQMENCTQKAMKCESTLQKYYLHSCYRLAKLLTTDAYKFKNAPIVSVDVERCFSYMNRLLSPQCQKLTTEHIRWLL